jgi:hypothetical protein
MSNLDDDDEDPDLDDANLLAEIERIGAAENAARRAAAPTSAELQRAVQEKEELRRMLEETQGRMQILSGENSILRLNLDSKAVQYQKELEATLVSQSKITQGSKAEIEELRKQVEQLKTERTFLTNEIHDVSLQYKLGKGKQLAASQTKRTEAPDETSPKHTKKKVRIDLETSFRDGFDSSPKRRTKDSTSKLLTSDHYSSSPTAAPQVESPLAGSPGHDYQLNANQPEALPDRRTVVLLEVTSRAHFIHLIYSHNVPGTTDRTLEHLVKYMIPESDCNVSAVLQRCLHDEPTAPLLGQSPATRFVEGCVSMLSKFAQTNWLDPCFSLLALLQTAIEFEPERVLEVTIEPCLRILVKLIDLCLPSTVELCGFSHENLPSFSNITVPLHLSKPYLILLFALDVLQLVTNSCVLDAKLHRACWSCVGFDVLRCLLSPRLPPNILARTVTILCHSVGGTSIGHINRMTDTIDVTRIIELQFDQESQLLDTVARMLAEEKFVPTTLLLFAGLDDYPHIDTPGAVTCLDIEECSRKQLDLKRRNDEELEYELYVVNEQTINALHRIIVKFFVKVILKRGVDRVVDGCSMVATVVECISNQLNVLLYRLPGDESEERVALIGECIRLLHAVWNLYGDPGLILRRLTGHSIHQHIVALARVALSEPRTGDLFILRFDEDVIEMARDILEQSTTLTESDDIYLAMKPA